MLKTTFPSISSIRKKFPQFTFTEHETFHWSPKEKTIFYDPKEVNTSAGFFQLLHEMGHALLNHTWFSSGVQLLKIETSAWKKARLLAAEYNLEIDPAHIEECLDTYRNWLYLRSGCPSCDNISLEVEENYYHCFNCSQKWKVPSGQQLRNYRLKLDINL